MDSALETLMLPFHRLCCYIWVPRRPAVLSAHSLIPKLHGLAPKVLNVIPHVLNVIPNAHTVIPNLTGNPSLPASTPAAPQI